ncbi:uncharacterized protein LOC135403073 isoform X1 [Pseudopipra pipra]|uniref:uncharacterized protein LOC135403073 isoform X1 n=1 Tax=Pseudopipra pipra TaxID=415032 RepID=UPI003139F84E
MKPPPLPDTAGLVKLFVISSKECIWSGFPFPALSYSTCITNLGPCSAALESSTSLWTCLSQNCPCARPSPVLIHLHLSTSWLWSSSSGFGYVQCWALGFQPTHRSSWAPGGASRSSSPGQRQLSSLGCDHSIPSPSPLPPPLSPSFSLFPSPSSPLPPSSSSPHLIFSFCFPIISGHHKACFSSPTSLFWSLSFLSNCRADSAVRHRGLPSGVGRGLVMSYTGYKFCWEKQSIPETGHRATRAADQGQAGPSCSLGLCRSAPHTGSLRRLLRAAILPLKRFCGIKLQVRGTEHLNIKEPYVIVCNHQASLDLVGMAEVIPERCVPIAKKELLYMGTVGWACWLSGIIFIDRHRRDAAIDVISQTARTMWRENLRVWVFPEGTRNQNKSMLPFKRGAFHLAVQAQVPIFPIVISPYWDFFSSKEKKFTSGTCTIQILPKVETRGLSPEDVPELTEAVRRAMADALAEMSGNPRGDQGGGTGSPQCQEDPTGTTY